MEKKLNKKYQQQYSDLTVHVHNWMKWFIEGKGEYDGHNYNSDHPDVDISYTTSSGLGLAVEMAQESIKNECELTKYFTGLDSRYLDFILNETPIKPDYLRKNNVRLTLWNIYYWLRKAHEELKQTQNDTNNS